MFYYYLENESAYNMFDDGRKNEMFDIQKKKKPAIYVCFII
jgi:hypothetical protein